MKTFSRMTMTQTRLLNRTMAMLTTRHLMKTHHLPPQKSAPKQTEPGIQKVKHAQKTQPAQVCLKMLNGTGTTPTLRLTQTALGVLQQHQYTAKQKARAISNAKPDTSGIMLNVKNRFLSGKSAPVRQNATMQVPHLKHALRKKMLSSVRIRNTQTTAPQKILK